MITLRIYEKKRVIKTMNLDAGTFILGRTRECGIFIHDQAVSRRHAEVTVKDNPPMVTVKDLDSANGFTFEGRRVKKAVLSMGQAIKIGSLRITVDEPEIPTGVAIPDIEPLLPTDPNSIPEILKIKPRDSECRAMIEVAKALNTNMKLEEILALVAKITGRSLEADDCMVLLYDKKTGSLTDPCAKEKMAESEKDGSFSKTVANHVVKRHVPLLIKSVAADDTFGSCKSLTVRGVNSVICVPLTAPEGTLGAIYAACRETGGRKKEFDDDDLMFATNIGSLASTAVINATLRDKVDRETRRRVNLERYVSPQVVGDIVNGGRNLELGGCKTTVSVIFSDIRNFTKLSEPMAPRDVVRLLNEYFSAMTEIIFENSGTLDKFIGDEIMATFGVPLENPKHAEQAVKTAIDMMRALRELKTSFLRKMLPIFEIGIGINSGEVISGNIGSMKRMEYTVIGDAVNTASRLVSAARPGQIIVNETTYELTRNLFDFNPLPPIEVKGKTGKLRIFEVLVPK